MDRNEYNKNKEAKLLKGRCFIGIINILREKKEDKAIVAKKHTMNEDSVTLLNLSMFGHACSVTIPIYGVIKTLYSKNDNFMLN
ncbi:hypothetical protein HZS_8135 [Henneguya salminicola]|nr:hypothetical protein HZS_8135 [Henneguya salminicola]